jgi:hypothetical protein
MRASYVTVAMESTIRLVCRWRSRICASMLTAANQSLERGSRDLRTVESLESVVCSLVSPSRSGHCIYNSCSFMKIRDLTI